MTKRALSLIIAAILPITLLCGCSAKQLTADEYRDEVIAAFKDWDKAMDDWAHYCIDNVMVEGKDDTYDYSFEKMPEHKSELKKKLNAVEDALDKIDKVGDPPTEYSDFHKKLKNGVSLDRIRIDLHREIFSAESEEDFNAAIKAANEHVDSTTDVSLSQVFIEIITQWDVNVGEFW